GVDSAEDDQDDSEKVSEPLSIDDIRRSIFNNDPELAKKHNEAWREYVAAHAADRDSVFGSLIERSSGWTGKFGERLQKRFNKSGLRRQAAMHSFNELYKKIEDESKERFKAQA